jgi:hypothetical protein
MMMVAPATAMATTAVATAAATMAEDVVVLRANNVDQ